MSTDIFVKINNFHKQAAIIPDMAKRIMYSLIPSVNSNQVDIRALKAAVEGINDIIKYGSRAVIEEMRHSRDEFDYLQAKEYFDANNLEDCLKECFESFNNPRNWKPQYGGYAWAKITRSLLSLTNLRSGLKATIENKDYTGELQVMKDIIIELNIFDGLAHNTASIMKNLIEEEVNESKDKDNKSLPYLDDLAHEQLININKAQELLNSKELMDPMDVYKEIEKTLIDSGDIHRFKDFSTKLRSKKEYHQDNSAKVLPEKFLISTRKLIKSDMNGIHEYLLKIKNDFKKFDLNESSISQILENSANVRYSLKQAIHIIYNAATNNSGVFNASNLDRLQNTILKEYKPLTNKITNTLKLLNQCDNDINRFRDHLEAISFDDMGEYIGDDKEEAESTIETIIDDCNKAYFVLDTF